MTLVVVSQVSLARGPTLLAATDSVLSAGYRWPRGPKLFPLGACAIAAFEGDTQLAYPLLINAQNFISFSDNLSGIDAEPAAIFNRVQMDVTDAYNDLVQSRYFDPADANCSLILAGWSWRLNVPVVWQLSPPPPGAPPGSQWQKTDLVAGQDWRTHQCFFAGSGDCNPVEAAWSDVRGGAVGRNRFPAYSAFLARVHDQAETAVGGIPQIALLGPRTREILGITDAQRRRYLLGHYVPSGAYEMVDYYDEHLATLQ